MALVVAACWPVLCLRFGLVNSSSNTKNAKAAAPRNPAGIAVAVLVTATAAAGCFTNSSANIRRSIAMHWAAARAEAAGAEAAATSAAAAQAASAATVAAAAVLPPPSRVTILASGIKNNIGSSHDKINFTLVYFIFLGMLPDREATSDY